MLSVQVPTGWRFWPAAEVALVRDEWGGRVEVTHVSGEVGHRPGPLPTGPPWHAVDPATLVHPAHARRQDGHLVLPGGWRLPAADLPEPPAEPPPDPAERLAWLQHGVWLTRAGEVPGDPPRDPALVPAGRHRVYPHAVRALDRRGPKGVVTLAGGFRYEAEWTALDRLRAALDLPVTDPRLRRLRDWPKELLDATSEELQEWFGGDLELLVDHVLWQTYRLRQRGGAQGYGRSPRGLVYQPLLPILGRAGHLPTAAESLVEGFHRLVNERLELFVGEWRLFTYTELGMVDSGRDHRLIGEVHPEVVLVAEKSTVGYEARLVALVFGVSLIILGGAPKGSASEFFAAAVRSRLRGPLRLVSYCDFDPYGWYFPGQFRTKLERYAISVVEALHRLVLPARFTPAELDRVAFPLEDSERARRWVEESGGVGGRALGLYADAFRPVERLVAAFREETGLEPVMTLDEARRLLEEPA